MFHNEPIDLCQFVAPKTTVVGQFDRLQPEFRVTAGMRNVYVGRLPRLEAVEEEPVPPNA